MCNFKQHKEYFTIFMQMRLLLTYIVAMMFVGGYAQTSPSQEPVAYTSATSKVAEKKTTAQKKIPSKRTSTAKSATSISTKNNHKGNTEIKSNKPCMGEFYASCSLKPDSALNPYLYYQVYDWLGTRYKYSGNSKKGIDCSGFVSEMYRNTYCIHLNGSSGSIFTQVTPVEKVELREGDILFFKIRKKQISHVGVYLGNNKFAHASVHSGVIVSDLDEAYYKKYFYKGRRLLSE